MTLRTTLIAVCITWALCLAIFGLPGIVLATVLSVLIIALAIIVFYGAE